MKNVNYVTEIEIQRKPGKFWLLNSLSNFIPTLWFYLFSLKGKLYEDYMFL